MEGTAKMQMTQSNPGRYGNGLGIGDCRNDCEQSILLLLCSVVISPLSCLRIEYASPVEVGVNIRSEMRTAGCSFR